MLLYDLSLPFKSIFSSYSIHRINMAGRLNGLKCNDSSKTLQTRVHENLILLRWLLKEYIVTSHYT